MKVQIEDREIRLAKVIPIGYDTLYVKARVYNQMLAVHPSFTHQNAGVWTCTFVTTGQAIMELPSQDEAECFTLEFLKDIEIGRVEVSKGPEGPGGVPEFTIHLPSIQAFMATWAERRKLALPAYQAKKKMPSGIELTGWEKLGEKVR